MADDRPTFGVTRRTAEPMRLASRPTTMKVCWLLVAVGLTLSGCAMKDSTDVAGNPSSASGIKGRTLLSPGCPVEYAASPCPASGVAAKIQVTKVGSTAVVAQVVSASDGTFKLSLEPGQYAVTATVDESVPMPQTKQLDVTVKTDSYVSVELQFDSGIRNPGPVRMSE